MKIALCFSGQPRSLEEGYIYHEKNLLALNHNLDVFIHTWYDPSLVGQAFEYSTQEVNVKSYQEESVSRIFKLYKPVSIKIEKPKNFIAEQGYKKSSEGWDSTTKEAKAVRTNNIFSQFYSIYQANRLKKEHEVEQNFVYDVCVRSRFDFALNVGIKFDELPFEKEVLYVPDLKLGNNPHFNDQFAFGGSRAMDKYSNIYLNCDKFFDEKTQRFFTEGPEAMHYKNCTDQLVILKNIDVHHPFLPNGRGGNSSPHSLIR